MPRSNAPQSRGAARRGLLGLSRRQTVGIAVVVLVAAVGLVLWDLLGPWSAGQWSAAAAVATAIVALVAAFVGLRQLHEAQALRREQAQPYVAVYMEPLAAVDPKFQELVVKNFGATAAFNVGVEAEPTLTREWQGQPQEVPLPVIPTLVPGQEWRVLWDFFPNRETIGLPERHRVEVAFEDSQGERFSLRYVLDWGINRDRLSVTTYGVHHGVKELKAIRERLDR